MAKISICGNCKYWQDVEKALPKTQQKGQCRRYPPAIGKDALKELWPYTGYFWDCGEFNKKKK